MGRPDQSPAAVPSFLRPLTVAIFVATATSACQSDNDDKAVVGTDFRAVATLPDDATILGKVYGQGSRAPAGFYVDPRSDTQISYSIHHIDSTSIIDPAAVDPDASAYELCSDDMSEALDWSETAERYRALSGDLIAMVENDRYFEFMRTLGDLSDWVSYARVFKCSYLDRGAAVAGSINGSGGTLNRRPLDAPSLQNLSEYLWTFSTFNNYAHVVLSSTGAESPTLLTHTLTMATLTPGAGLAVGCDLVQLRDWELAVTKQTGTIDSRLHDVAAFDARLVGGQPMRCD